MKYLLLPFLLVSTYCQAQDKMTPELLWSLKRVSGINVSDDGKTLYYSSRQIDWKTEKSTSKQYALDLQTGNQKEWSLSGGKSYFQRDKETIYATAENNIYRSTDNGLNWTQVFNGLRDADNIRVSPNGKYVAFSREVLIKPMMGTDIYNDLPKTTAQVYTDLNYRHWDTWEDGKFQHVFIFNTKDGSVKDIMLNEPYDTPQKPFGGVEDFVWSPDSKGLLYVCKKKFGKEYAQSTNTDLYYYNLENGTTTNWTVNMEGYDTQPQFSPDGKRIAWTSMRREGFEADKNDIFVMDLAKENGYKVNLTGSWDGTVESFAWDKSGTAIYFVAPWKGTEQLFEVKLPANRLGKMSPVIRQVTDGKFNITGIVGQASNKEWIV
ncbi:MAG: family peptidase, partial [Flavipsychrobacter sp.]|nr:family peptidase [Flavipsychrobacter sp.]